MSNEDFQKARQALKNIFDTLLIEKIVYVDDTFDFKLDVEVVIGDIQVASPEEITNLNELIPGVEIELENDVWKTSVRDYWDSLDRAHKTEFGIQIAKVLNNKLDLSSEADYIVSKRVKELVPENCVLHELSPSDWEDTADELMSSASPNSKLLCIFDQDLSRSSEAGYTSAGSKSGSGLMRNAIEKYKNENVFYVLFSHTIESVEGEFVRWRELEVELGIPLSLFLPLAKVRCSDDNPLLFADGIKKAVLNSYLEKLKTETLKLFEDAYTNSVTNLKSLGVYELDYILRAASSEGEWEAEILVRVFQIFLRNYLQESLLSPQNAFNFNKELQRTRPISSVDTNPVDDGYINVINLRKLELYDKPNLIAYSPIQLGDIFDWNDKTWILLAQPCDLAIRESGEREINNLVVPLIPLIEEISVKSAKEKRGLEYWRSKAPLMYYLEDYDRVGILGFKEAQWVNIDVLDIATLNSTGECKLNLKKLKIPDHLPVVWQKRLTFLFEKYNTYAQELEKVTPTVRRIKRKDVGGLLWQNSLPKFTFVNSSSISYSKQEFDFGVKRIGRFRQRGAETLLKSFAQYMSRDADQVNFAKKLKT
jgi:hypothetical protein